MDRYLSLWPCDRWHSNQPIRFDSIWEASIANWIQIGQFLGIDTLAPPRVQFRESSPYHYPSPLHVICINIICIILARRADCLQVERLKFKCQFVRPLFVTVQQINDLVAIDKSNKLINCLIQRSNSISNQRKINTGYRQLMPIKDNSNIQSIIKVMAVTNQPRCHQRASH